MLRDFTESPIQQNMKGKNLSRDVITILQKFCPHAIYNIKASSLEEYGRLTPINQKLQIIYIDNQAKMDMRLATNCCFPDFRANKKKVFGSVIKMGQDL